MCFSRAPRRDFACKITEWARNTKWQSRSEWHTVFRSESPSLLGCVSKTFQVWVTQERRLCRPHRRRPGTFRYQAADVSLPLMPFYYPTASTAPSRSKSGVLLTSSRVSSRLPQTILSGYLEGTLVTSPWWWCWLSRGC